ncbi:MAG: class A beta-lactamase-related serine hydrolase [Desulfobulbaceae bacterium]|jgi:beta-lactamase class A|nr:class A beta-lactamase-related serine hydrolase [Desulfobulbaceae bacterium]
MRFTKCLFGIVLTGYLTVAVGAMAAEQRFDLVYAWDKNLNAILDYKEVLEGVVDEKTARHLKVVGRGDEYGVIYDMNGTLRQAAREIIRQANSLLGAGLSEANAVIDDGAYSRLYNICYGYGPNLNILKEKYHRLYSYLGKELGDNLAIERASERNYALIYRMRASQDKAADLMARHKKLLRPKKIQVTLTAANNNPVVYGESSLLDDNEDVADNTPRQAAPAQEVNHLKPANDPPEQKIVEPPPPVATASIFERRKKSRVLRDPDAASSVVRSGLAKEIDQLVGDLYRQGQLGRDERCAWMVYDVENDQPLVNINGNQLFQAASMIKPFVALAFFHQVEAGKLQYNQKARQMVERMIQRSSNEATNWVMRQVGGPNVCARILRGNYGRIFKKTQIVEYIPVGGKTYRNKVIPSDYVRFLSALWDMKLPYSKELRRVMALPGSDRIYQGTTIPKGTLVYNKTGSTARLCGDMGILAPPPKSGAPAYAMVGVIERGSNASDYSSWIRRRGNIIRQVSSLVYKEIRNKR